MPLVTLRRRTNNGARHQIASNDVIAGEARVCVAKICCERALHFDALSAITAHVCEHGSMAVIEPLRIEQLGCPTQHSPGTTCPNWSPTEKLSGGVSTQQVHFWLLPSTIEVSQFTAPWQPGSSHLPQGVSVDFTLAPSGSGAEWLTY